MQDKIILGILNLLGSCSTYRIKKYMEKSTNHFYNSSLGSIHPAFKKLEKNKWVSVEEQIENGRAKKMYSITKSGKQELLNWLTSDATIGKIKDELLLKIFFFADLNKEQRKTQVSDYLNIINDKILNLKSLKKELNMGNIPEQYKEVAHFQVTTLDFGIDYYEFIYNWYKKHSEELQNPLQ